MYGRDVLGKRAGTCIDLAILFASACEAVGLEPVLILPPGHCFPAVKLFDKERHEIGLIGVETTMIGRYEFEEALRKGKEELQEALQQHHLRVDICGKQAQGACSLPLPTRSLKDLGIDEDDPRWAQGTGQSGTGPGTTTGAGSADHQPVTLAGKWFAHGRLPDNTYYEWTLTFNKDGSYHSLVRYAAVMLRGAGMPREEDRSGTYKVGPQAIVFTTTDGHEQICEHHFNAGRLLIIMPHLQYNSVALDFARVPD
jgi:hypothetical protein